MKKLKVSFFLIVVSLLMMLTLYAFHHAFFS